ncbi:MAG: ABC transporter ATP-binding protein [Deltaproteobacteria bacterium]
MMNVRRSLALLSPVAAELALAVACMAVLTIATAVGAELVGPVLHSLVLGVPDASVGWLLGGRSMARADAIPLILPAALVTLALVKGGAYFGQFYLVGMAGQRVSSGLRKTVLAEIVRAGPAFLTSVRTGDLLSRLSSDIGAVELGVTYALAAYVRDSMTAIALLGLCLWLDWRLALLAFGLLPLTIGPLARLARRLIKATRRVQAGFGDLGHRLAEGLQGLRLVQVDGLQEREAQRFQLLSRQQLDQELRMARLRAIGSPLMEIVAVLGLCLMLWIASAEVAGGKLSPERLVSFLAAALLAAQPLKSLGKVGPLGVSALAATERLFDIEDAARRSHVPPATGHGGADFKPEGFHDVHFEGVWFAYPETSMPLHSEERRWVLQDFDLRLGRGERVGLAGASGSGKTTAIALLLGLHAPSRGRITVDGRDLATLTVEQRRKLFAWVGQEHVLLDATIAENVALGTEVDPQRIELALRRSGAFELVERIGGADARVGERGARFSGGERQRLAIARAFYRGAQILVLDEPTSQLDAEAELRIAQTLDGALAGRTALVVAHRPVTLSGCDRVAMLEHGRVVPAPPAAREGNLVAPLGT